MNIIHLLPGIDQTIWNKAGDLGHQPKQKRKRGQHHNRAVVPDAVILEMRRMHEIERKTSLQVCSSFPQFTERYVRSVLGYLVRANLRVLP
jgi:hypothetical protein